MRIPAAAILLTACTTTDELSVELEADPPVCSPGATSAPPPVPGGPLPVGTYPIAWRCLEGCDPAAPALVITLTETVQVDPGGTISWLQGPLVLWQSQATIDGGCWRLPRSEDGCISAHYLCATSGSPVVAHLAHRDIDTGDEQIWRME